MFDDHANFAYSTVDVPPSPKSSGNTLSIHDEDVDSFPTPPFNATVWPANTIPKSNNSTIIRVTSITGQEFTFTRSQESSNNREIQLYDQIAATITKKTITDIEQALQSKIYITVGATGDVGYITDGINDHVEINAAITAVNAAGGGTVFLKGGTYNLSARIVPKSNVWIKGENNSNTIINGPSGANVIGDSVSGTTKTVRSNYRISDLKLVGNNRDPIYIHNTDGVVVENCDVTISNEAATWHGINTTYCQNVNIHNNYVHDITGNGIAVNGCNNFRVTNNLVVNCTDDNIDIDFDFRESAQNVPSLYGVVTDNICQGIGETAAVGQGIRVEGSKYVTISNNYCDDNDCGINVNSASGMACQYITITNNIISNCTEWGIKSGAYVVTAPDEVGTRDNIIISGNALTGCGTTAFASRIRGGILLWSEDTIVKGNTLDNCGNNESLGQESAAILIYVKSNNSVIGNHISDSVNGIKTWNDGSRTYTTTKIYDNYFRNNSTNLDISEATNPAFTVADGGTGAITAAGARTNLGVPNIAGDTFTGDIIVPDEAYGSGWNGSLEVPTKNAVYDKIQTLLGSTAYTPTNVTTDRSYDANATTTDELADVLGTLIADLIAKGILS